MLDRCRLWQTAKCWPGSTMHTAKVRPVKTIDFVQRPHLAAAEVGRLVHVDPQAVEWRHVVQSGELPPPPVAAARVEEVGVVHWPRPDL